MRIFNNQIRKYQTYEINTYFPTVCVIICFYGRDKLWQKYVDADTGYELSEDDLILREIA